MFATIDARDLVYTMIGLALLGLTFQGPLSRYRLFNLPFFYVFFGALLGGLGLAQINPLNGGWQSLVIEHASELIVIVSLAGAGLAIDTVSGWRRWGATWRLLAITMPVTIAVLAWGGYGLLGLPLPSALLLAASLAPTDPVLARSVHVAPPGEGEEPLEVALTAEAGLNDGLAFPFIYLAIHAATLGISNMFDGQGWFWPWLGFDFAYRVLMGIAVGYLVGHAISRLIFSPLGDGQQGAQNATVVVLSSVMLSYGIAEGVDGYGFLAVFIAARAARSTTRDSNIESYDKQAHHGADQLEAILLAILLLWLGTFTGAGALAGMTWAEVGFAAGLIFILRPIAGYLSLQFMNCNNLSRRHVAFFGVRGMGSVFYIAYAQNHADFADIDAVWRIAAVTILMSIFVHGYGAKFALDGQEVLGNPDAEEKALNRK